MEINYSVEGFKEGQILLINKPLHWTSFDVVNKIRISLRNHLGIKKIKVGHAGTLDPLASGLVIVCTGKSTKKIEMEAVNIAETKQVGLIIVSASRDYGLDDILFGPKESHVVKKSNIPVLLVNPRGDLYALCD